MTDYGVKPTGFKAKPFSVIQEETQTDARSAFGSETLDTISPEGFLASIYQPLNERLDQLWKLAEIVYNAPDPRRSTGQSYDVVGALRGVTRKPATRGVHDDPGVTMTFDGAVAGTILRGTIRFHPEGVPGNVWINSTDFTIGGAGDYVVVSESELVGADKTLPEASTITVLEGPSALTGITVPAGAVGGTDIEAEVTWRVRSEAAIDETQTPVGAAVEDVPNVSTARVIETPGYIRVVVNDLATPAADDDIAQAILDAKCAGVVPIGDESGDAIDANGETVPIAFDRAESLRATATATVTSAAGYSATAIKSAIQSAQPKLPGETAIWADLFCAARAVDGVDNLTLVIALHPGAESIQDLPAGVDQLIEFDDADITVTTA